MKVCGYCTLITTMLLYLVAEAHDPFYSSEYATNIYSYMKQREVAYFFFLISSILGRINNLTLLASSTIDKFINACYSY